MRHRLSKSLFRALVMVAEGKYAAASTSLFNAGDVNASPGRRATVHARGPYLGLAAQDAGLRLLQVAGCRGLQCGSCFKGHGLESRDQRPLMKWSQMPSKRCPRK